MEVTVRWLHVSNTFSSLPPSPAPVWGPIHSHSRASATQIFPSWAAVLHQLPQHVPSSIRGSPSGTNFLRVCVYWDHMFCQQACFKVGFSLHGATAPARSLLQHGHLTVSQPPSGIHLLQLRLLHKIQVDLCIPVKFLGLQGNLSPWPSFSTDLIACRTVSFRYFPLSPSCHLVLFLLLKYSKSQCSSGQRQGSVGAGWKWLCQGIRSFWCLLTEATWAVPPLPKFCHVNPKKWIRQERPLFRLWTLMNSVIVRLAYSVFFRPYRNVRSKSTKKNL